MDRQRGRSDLDPEGRATPGALGARPDTRRPTVYRIRVQGHLDDQWADLSEGLSVTREEGGDTVLTVPVVDQAALHGLLRKLRDVGVPLVSINPAEAGPTGNPSRKENR